MLKQLSISFAATAVLMLASCGQGDVLRADNAVVKVSPVEGNPSVAYMDLHGGRVEVDLVSVTSDDVVRMEMHETTEEDGMAMMRPVKSINILPGAKVKMEPGGKHLMLWGVSDGAIKRGLLQFKLIYSNDDRILIDAVIQKPTPAGTETGDDKAESSAE
ncbi:MAG: copper chaperone PCu(A)C [Parasphingorhabdus sp.]